MNDSGESARVLLQRAEFHSSYPEPRLLPADVGCEVAFAGRSNSGKSSAINALCAQRGLARTSRTPGRTQHLVVFQLDGSRRLIDLPGFGYAKVAKSMRAHWERALPEYLQRRQSLRGLVLLMDCRHPLKPQDQALIEWCAAAEVALHILLSKSDKLGSGAGSAALHEVQKYLAKHAAGNASVQLFSTLKQRGYETAWEQLGGWLNKR